MIYRFGRAGLPGSAEPARTQRERKCQRMALLPGRKSSARKRGFQEGLPIAPLLTPAALISSLSFIVPLVIFLRFSFNHHVPLQFMETAWSLENYIEFFSTKYYLDILWRTVKIAFLSTVITLVMALPVAGYMSRVSGRTKSIFVMLLVFPMMLGSVVRGIGWMAMFSEMGMVNKILLNLNIIEKSLPLLYTEGSVIWAIASINLPIMILTLEAVYESISPDLEYAAYNLGASKIQVFFRVTLPLTIPGVIAGTSLAFVQSMNAYSTPRMVGGSRIKMMSPAIYSEIAESANWPSGAAMAFILLVLTLVVTYAYTSILENRYRRIMHL